MSRWLMVGMCALGLAGVLSVSARAEEKKKPELKPIAALDATEVEMTAKIQQALNEKTAFDFDETPLNEVAEYLKQKHQIEVQLDLRNLEDASIGPDTPVTRKLSGISLRSALRMMLGALDLTYLIKNETLLITTPDRANNELVIQIYPVADLATLNPPELGGEDYQQLIDAITTSVSPTSWEAVGGPGAIAVMSEARSLVITQTAEVHEQIVKLLPALRKARDAQPQAPRRTALGASVEQLKRALHRQRQLQSLTDQVRRQLGSSTAEERQLDNQVDAILEKLGHGGEAAKNPPSAVEPSRSE